MKKSFFILLLIVNQHLAAQNPIIIPDTLSGTRFNLTLQYGTHPFFNGTATNTMGANGSILGPTLIFNQGDSVSINVTNQLNDTTTIHWHGLHVAPENDGGPHTTIAPGATWSPAFTVLDKAATYWYHPHLHKKTNEHVSKGIAGIIIVRDAEEAALTLPRRYGVDDFPLVLQTKDFNPNNQIVVPSNADDVAMVNATINGSLEVPAQIVRLRLLNGSSMRVFNVGLGGNQTFYQIASDGGLLSSPLALTRLPLGPGERAEILVDFSALEGQSLLLKSYAAELANGIYGATYPGLNTNMTLDGYNPNPLNGADFTLLQFNVVAATNNPVTAIPTSLVTVTPIPESGADLTRELVMSPVTMGLNQLNGDFVINDVPFNMAIINYDVPLNNTEIWSITNQSAIAHPFHIHDVQFYVLDRDGQTPPANERGRKDVIMVKPQETVRFITKFENFANNTVPYMYHCHMLYHEDRGMMGQFLVVDRIAGLGHEQGQPLAVFPNPASTTIRLAVGPEIQVQAVTITNLLGKTVFTVAAPAVATPIDISQLPAGVYIVKLLHQRGEASRRLVIE